MVCILEIGDGDSAEQLLLGDFPQAVTDAVMESHESHQNLMMQYLNNPAVSAEKRLGIFGFW